LLQKLPEQSAALGAFTSTLSTSLPISVLLEQHEEAENVVSHCLSQTPESHLASKPGDISQLNHLLSG
jgi:hypothetical protein